MHVASGRVGIISRVFREVTPHNWAERDPINEIFAMPGKARDAPDNRRRLGRALPQRRACGPRTRAHAAPLPKVNARPAKPSVVAVFARVRWLSRTCGKSGRKVQVGFLVRFSGLLMYFCGPNHRHAVLSSLGSR